MNKYFFFFIISAGYLLYSVWPTQLGPKESAAAPLVCSKDQESQLVSPKNARFGKESKLARSNSSNVKWDLTHEEIREKWKVQSYHEIEKLDFESPLGSERVYRFSQNGVPIVGMELRIRKEVDGTVWEKENSYQPISEVKINQSYLLERATQVPAEVNRYKVSAIAEEATVIFVREHTGQGELAFAVSGQDKSLGNRATQLMLRVEDGKVLQRTVGRADFNF